MTSMRKAPSTQSINFSDAGSTVVPCTHCTLPVPTGLLEPGDPQQFCCAGCRTAYAVIHSCGLDRYYELRERLERSDERAPVRSTNARFAEFDDAAFQAVYCGDLDSVEAPKSPTSPSSPTRPLRTVELFIEGVHCSACVWLVERLPRVCPGVVDSRLDLRRGMVRVVWDDQQVKLSRIARSLDSLGYPPHPARDASDRRARRADDHRQLIRLGVAGACASNVMLLGLALYAGLFDGMEPAYVSLFRVSSMLVSVVSLVWPGAVFFRSAWAAIRTGTMHLDIPISLALGAGGLWGVISTISGTGEIYFDTLSVLVFLLLVGRFIQHHQQRRSLDAVEMLFSLTPTVARIVDDAGLQSSQPGVTREVSIQSVLLGQFVEVRAGESVPVDGVIVAGLSQVDQSLLTGESRPVSVETGDAVCAGIVNLASTIRLRVEATGAQTRVGRLMSLVQDSLNRKAPIVRLADRIAGWFLAGMLGLAAVTLGLWLWLEPSDPSLAIGHATALLVVTCPCALGLATPLALTVAIGRAAGRGILIKGGEAIQSLANPGLILLDKTGTLTQGRMSVVRWAGPEELKPIIGAIERQSDHPVARALADAFAPALQACVQSVQKLGAGITGTCGSQTLSIGSPDFIASIIGGIDDTSAIRCRTLGRAGLTPVLVSENGRVVASIGLGDALRSDSGNSVRLLQRQGWTTQILSGDHPTVVRSVADELKIPASDARGGVTPEGKLEAVTAAIAMGHSPVVMVGDGVNDAAAMAAATVGIAVHGGAEASLAAADVYLSNPGLSAVAELTTGARSTMRTIKLCLAASLCYNVAAAGLSVAGLISPLIAAIVMPASSLTVLALCVRSGAFRPPRRTP